MTTYGTVATSLVAALFIVGCSSPEGGETIARVAATDTVASTAPVADTSGGGAMAGMGHSNMPGMSGSDRSGEDAAATAMDHSGMAGMDHSNMPGMQTPAAGRQEMQGMDHSRMGGMQPVPAGGMPASGTDKLMTLVAELVRDPAVQERIRQDSVLRASWEDPDVRRILLNRP